MPSAGRTSMPTSIVAPLMSTFIATFLVAGSMVTIDLPSTRPTIQPAAWAELAMRDDATIAPASVMALLNIGVAPFGDMAPEPGGAGADGGSYGAAIARMQRVGGIFAGPLHDFVRIGWVKDLIREYRPCLDWAESPRRSLANQIPAMAPNGNSRSRRNRRPGPRSSTPSRSPHRCKSNGGTRSAARRRGSSIPTAGLSSSPNFLNFLPPTMS